MMCCGNCFNDRGLRHQIVPQLSLVVGNCEVCGSADEKIVEAKALGDYFETVCGIYTPDETGEILVDWLIRDWSIFSVGRAEANALLVEILDDGERVRQLVSPSERCDSSRLNDWEHLREELRHTNRFFPERDFDHTRLEKLLSNLISEREDIYKSWYRARISGRHEDIALVEMGAPPKTKVSHGRANPAGIPYLYLGSTQLTAVSEVRPHPGEEIVVAKFELAENLKCVDLRNPREFVSPFLIGDDEDVAAMRGDVFFLERLGEELTTPVLPHAAAIDYIPSQYLCEFIKRSSYSGVVYSSSVSDGYNLALFQPEDGTAIDKERYTVQNVAFEVLKSE